MDGDLDMDGHIVREALQLRATELVHSNQQITAPTIAGTAIVAKNRLSIQQGTEETNLYCSNLATLNDLSRLNCSSNERVTVSGGGGQLFRASGSTRAECRQCRWGVQR